MNVQQHRAARGWSQEDLARHAGLSTRTIQRLESGQKAGLESLKCLAAVFETSVSELAQEQTMASDQRAAKSVQPMLNRIEREAIEFAQSVLHGPGKGQKDPVGKIERDAIAYAKRLLEMFGR